MLLQLIWFVEICAAEQFAAKFEPSSLNVKNFLSYVAPGKTAPSQKIVKVLHTETRGRKKGNISFILSITATSL